MNPPSPAPDPIAAPNAGRRRTISLTPLIDVVFILLMFFMLTSSFIRERQIDMAAPVAATEPTDIRPLRLLLAPGGALLSAADRHPLASGALDSSPDRNRPVVLQPHPGVEVQTIVGTLERLHRQGFRSLSLGNPYEPEG